MTILQFCWVMFCAIVAFYCFMLHLRGNGTTIWTLGVVLAFGFATGQVHAQNASWSHDFGGGNVVSHNGTMYFLAENEGSWEQEIRGIQPYGLFYFTAVPYDDASRGLFDARRDCQISSTTASCSIKVTLRGKGRYRICVTSEKYIRDNGLNGPPPCLK
jgi:hypothetical protein